MTKEQYISIKKKNSIDIIYEYYKEFSNNKLLSYQEFFTYIQMWGDINSIYAKVCKEYESRLNISILYSKHGDILGYF